MRAGGLLAAVALLLVVVGAGINWMSDTDTDDPGDFRASKIKNLCDSVDTKPFKKLTPNEDGKKDSADTKSEPALFTCKMRLLADKEDTDYLAITLDTKARVASTVGDASDAFAGAVDYEKSKGRQVNQPKGIGDQAASVTVSSAAEQQECRVHVQSSNVMLSVTMFVSGNGTDCKKSPDALLDLSESTLDVMRSE